MVDALQSQRLRSMPNAFLPAVLQGQLETGSKEGILLIGDAWNMRHPLTGGWYFFKHTSFTIISLLSPVKAE